MSYDVRASVHPSIMHSLDERKFKKKMEIHLFTSLLANGQHHERSRSFEMTS